MAIYEQPDAATWAKELWMAAANRNQPKPLTAEEWDPVWIALTPEQRDNWRAIAESALTLHAQAVAQYPVAHGGYAAMKKRMEQAEAKMATMVQAVAGVVEDAAKIALAHKCVPGWRYMGCDCKTLIADAIQRGAMQLRALGRKERRDE